MINGSGVVDSARHGDALSFQTLVDRYQTPIFRYLYRLVGDTDRARDLTLDTFVAAHKKLNHVDRDLRFEAWLFRLATQRAASSLRLRHLLPWLAHGASAQLSVEDDRDAQTVQQTLLRLPSPAAVALLLWSIGGFSYDEIAGILHTSTRNVRARIGQARSRFLALSGAGQPSTNAGDCAAVHPLLSAYLDRQLSGEEHSAVEQHLATCVGGKAVIAGYQDLDRRLARMKSRGPSATVAYDVTRLLRGEKLGTPRRARSRRGFLLLGLGVAGTVIVVAAGAAVARIAAHLPPATTRGRLFVGLQNSEGQVVVVDTQSARVVSTIWLGARPLKLLPTRDGQRVYALGDNGIISVIDAVQYLATTRYEVSGRAGGMAISPDDRTLYVTLSDRRSLIFVDLESGRQTGEVRVGRAPREVVVSPDGQWIVVFNSGDNTVSKVKVSSKQEVKVLTLLRRGDAVTEFSLHPMAFAPDGRKVYVTELNRERIWSIDVSSDEASSFDVPLRDLGREIVVAPSSDRLYVTHGDPRGQRASQAGLASMMLPQVERNAEIRGSYSGVAISPDGQTIYATNPDDNVVIIADAQSLQTTATIPVGQRPANVVFVPNVR